MDRVASRGVSTEDLIKFKTVNQKLKKKPSTLLNFKLFKLNMSI